MRGLLFVFPTPLAFAAACSIEVERVRRRLAASEDERQGAAADAVAEGGDTGKEEAASGGTASADTERACADGVKPRSGDNGGRTVAFSTTLPSRGDSACGEPLRLRGEDVGGRTTDVLPSVCADRFPDALVGEALADEPVPPPALLPLVGDGTSPSRAQ
jgi:hypothetical protein